MDFRKGGSGACSCRVWIRLRASFSLSVDGEKQSLTWRWDGARALGLVEEWVKQVTSWWISKTSFSILTIPGSQEVKVPKGGLLPAGRHEDLVGSSSPLGPMKDNGVSVDPALLAAML